MLPPERGRMYLYQVAGRAQSPLVKPDLLDQGKGWVGGGWFWDEYCRRASPVSSAAQTSASSPNSVRRSCAHSHEAYSAS